MLGAPAPAQDERVAGLVCAGEEALPHTFFARVMEGQWEQFWGGMHGRGPPPRSDQALPAPEQQQVRAGARQRGQVQQQPAARACVAV